MESKFSVLDEVRSINIGNELSMTLSIGVGDRCLEATRRIMRVHTGSDGSRSWPRW